MKFLSADKSVERWSIVLMLALLLLFLAGCTEYEQAGFSPIPQNSPGGWELAPYGDFRN